MREHYVDLVVCYRRAIDYLETLQFVDAKRIGFVGHSYGAISGSALVAADHRIRTFVLLGGVARLTRHVLETDIQDWIDWRKDMSQEQLAHALTQIRPVDPDNFVGTAGHGPIFVQCGNFDFVNVGACDDLYKATSGPKQLRWYDTDHSFADLEATFDRMQWLQKELHLRARASATRSALDNSAKAVYTLEVGIVSIGPPEGASSCARIRQRYATGFGWAPR